jgi:preprotein translocase subunit YajC
VTVPLAAESEGNPLGSLLFMLAIVVGLYFVMIRPGRKRMAHMQAVQSNLAPGREVVTTAGMYGTVTELDEDNGTVTLEIAPGVAAKFARGAVMKVVDEPLPDGTSTASGDVPEQAIPAPGDDE